MYSSKYLELLIEELTRLPSIGPKSAQRLALHLLRASREDALRLAEAIRAVKERVHFCSVCGNFAEDDPCALCRDPGRDGSVVCVVEQPGDVLAFERTGQFRGRYHVLGGALSPLDGTHPEHLRIQELLDRPRAPGVWQTALPQRPPSARLSSPPTPTWPARRPPSTCRGCWFRSGCASRASRAAFPWAPTSSIPTSSPWAAPSRAGARSSRLF